MIPAGGDGLVIVVCLGLLVLLFLGSLGRSLDRRWTPRSDSRPVSECHRRLLRELARHD